VSSPLPRFGYLADEGKQQTLRGRLKAVQLVFEKDFKDAVAHPPTRRVFGRLIWELCQYGQHDFSDNNAHRMFLEGRQSVGQWLHDAIERECPELYDAMRAERRGEQAVNKSIHDSVTAETREEQRNGN
jgi:hypothetical protein